MSSERPGDVGTVLLLIGAFALGFGMGGWFSANQSVPTTNRRRAESAPQRTRGPSHEQSGETAPSDAASAGLASSDTHNAVLNYNRAEARRAREIDVFGDVTGAVEFNDNSSPQMGTHGAGGGTEG